MYKIVIDSCGELSEELKADGHFSNVPLELDVDGISIDRIMYIMNSKEETDETTAGGFPGNGDIEFRNVSFSYDNEKVLDNLSLKIKKGQTIGILGGTGSGKSTMIQLLDGLYDLPKENGSCAEEVLG